MNGDNMTNDMSRGVQTGVRAAQAAKAVGKAAGMAATGNVAGAAIEIAKNHDTRNFIIFLVVFLLFSVFAVCYLAPMAIYETLASFARELEDKFQDYKELAGGGIGGGFVALMRVVGETFWNAIRGVANFAKKVVSQVISAVKSKWPGEASQDNDKVVVVDNPSDNDVNSDYTDDDRDVISRAIQTAKTYKRKVQVMDALFNRREKELTKDILYESEFCQSTQKQDDPPSAKAKENSWIWKKFLAIFKATYPQHPVRFPERDSTAINALGRTIDITAMKYYKYCGVTVFVRRRTIKPQEALKLLSLYEILMTDTPDDVSMAGFAVWVGTKQGHDSIEYKLGDSGYTREPGGYYARQGGFMPKYLVIDETETKYREANERPAGIIGFIKQMIHKKIVRNAYDSMKVAPVDLLLKIKSPNPGECQGIESEPFFESDTVIEGNEVVIEEDYWQDVPEPAPSSVEQWLPTITDYSFTEIASFKSSEERSEISNLIRNNVVGESDDGIKLLGWSTNVGAIVSDGPISGGHGVVIVGPGGDPYPMYPGDYPHQEEEPEEPKMISQHVVVKREYNIAAGVTRMFRIDVTYNYPVSISIRDVDDLVKYAGFFSGPLNKV